ncbi:MAG TPA: hypothetical protein VJP88_04560 [Caulobacteraceae bacterium]|nr:hypothetical protein [Caulobacteraceae bacterium]
MNAFGARIAKVVAVFPEAHAANIIFLDDLSRSYLVQIMAGVSTDTGTVDLPVPDVDASLPQRATKTRDLYAVVMPIGVGKAAVPLIWGFLPPQLSQLLFKGRDNFKVTRHGSDVYSTLEDDGSFTMAWPNGTYLKVGANPAKEDLTGKDFDQLWAIKRNTAVAPHVHLVVADGAGAAKATLDIDPTGAISATGASFSVTSPSNTINGPLHVTQDITCDQTVTATTDVVGAGKSLKSHTHQVVNVQTGSSTVNSNPPT